MSKINLNKISYNNIASKWHKYRKILKLNPYIIKFAKLVKGDGQILDIGCGTGVPIAKYLSEEGFNVTGIDIAENMIDIAKSYEMPKTNFYVENILEYNTNNKYDGIIAFDSLFHIPIEKQKEVLLIISKLIKPDGIFMFTHGLSYGEVDSKMFGENFYYSSLDKIETISILASVGFQIVELIENYKDVNEERDLIIITRKIK